MPILPSRETRLLVVTIAVSIVMLLLLARLRFPQQRTLQADPVSAPLERLAARATYDELAGILRSLDSTISDSVLALRVASNGRDTDAAAPIVPAVLMPDGRALALVGVGRRPVGFIPERPMRVVESDAPRGLVVLDGPADSAVSDWTDQLPALAGPGYVAAVEGTRSGPAIRPVYFGRADQVSDPRWPGTILRLSALQQMLPSGAALFTLQGTFIGIGFPEDRDLLVVPAAVLRAEADALARTGSVPFAETGIEAQALDLDAAAATGAASGVMVTFVRPASSADGVLQAGDVITAVNGTDVHSMAQYVAATMNLRPGFEAAFTRVRAGQSEVVRVTPTTRGAGPEQVAEGFGIELRAAPGGGVEVVRLTPRTAAARAGILPGDVITMMAGTKLPSETALRRAYDRMPSGGRLLLGIERGAAHLVVTLTKR